MTPCLVSCLLYFEEFIMQYLPTALEIQFSVSLSFHVQCPTWRWAENRFHRWISQRVGKLWPPQTKPWPFFRLRPPIWKSERKRKWQKMSTWISKRCIFRWEFFQFLKARKHLCHQWSPRPDPQSPVAITIFNWKLFCFARFWRRGRPDRLYILNTTGRDSIKALIPKIGGQF